MKIIKPDWKNSILNVSATLADYIGVKTDIDKIAILEKELNKNYKNVVYICMDGLGMFPLEQNLYKSSILRKSVAKTITSVFPSTTTNATSTLYSATYPSQHGLFGWSLYFEQLNACVDIYTGHNSYTTEPVDMSKISDYLTFESYFGKSQIPAYTVFPAYMKYLQTNTHGYNFKTIEEAFTILKEIVKVDEKKFVYCYFSEPDGTMHKYGTTSQEAKKLIENLNKLTEDLASQSADTLIVITPDHGQTDIKSYIPLYENKDLMKTLKTPLFLEARAAGFFVKKECENKFLQEMEKYKDKIKLFKTKDLIDDNFFGPKTDKLNMLGDYIAIVKNDYEHFLFQENNTRFKGHHTGLTKKEMVLPLIMIKNK